MRAGRSRSGLDLGFDAAGASEAPAAESFVDGKEAGGDQHEAPEGNITGDDDSGHEAKRANHATGDAPLTPDVGPEEIAHAQNLPQPFYVASCGKLRQRGREWNRPTNRTA